VVERAKRRLRNLEPLLELIRWKAQSDWMWLRSTSCCGSEMVQLGRGMISGGSIKWVKWPGPKSPPATLFKLRRCSQLK
jgi:hypothetical protein